MLEGTPESPHRQIDSSPLQVFAADAFQALLQCAPDPIIIVDETGRIASLNRRVELTFGYEQKDLLGEPIETVVPETLRDIHVTHRRQFQTAPRVRPMGSGQQLVVRRRDGREVPVDISLSPLRIDGRKFVIAIARDVSERVTRSLPWTPQARSCMPTQSLAACSAGPVPA